MSSPSAEGGFNAERNAPSSVSQTGAPSTWYASAAKGSRSPGTLRPFPSTVVAASAPYTSIRGLRLPVAMPVDAPLIRRAEEEGPRVHRGGKKVLGLLALHRVVEGQLGQHEEVLAAQALPGTPERGQDQLRIRVEALPEAEACQQLLRVLARTVGREHVGGHRAVHRLGAHVGDADRRRTGATPEQDGNQRHLLS